MSKFLIKKRDQDTRIERVIMLYIAIKPLYVFGSGGMQLSDLLLAFSFVWMFIQSRCEIMIPNEGKKWFNKLIIFTIYTIVVNVFWYLYLIGEPYKSTTLVSSILYYIFNVLAVIVCMNITYRVGIDRTIKAVLDGATFSSIIILFGIVLNMGKGERNSSFFNNPNQLGFFAIILLTFVCLYHDRIKKSNAIIIIVSSVTAMIVSLSKASFVSVFALGFFYFISSKCKTPRQMLIRGSAIILLGVVLYIFLYGNISYVNNNEVLYELKNRILHMSRENDSNLGTGRGYDRVFEMGKHLLWGMGEGAYDRFSIMRGLEIHSTYANIIVSYGIVGSLLALGVFALPFKAKGTLYRNLCCISGVLLYSVSHNGIRNTVVWIMLACLVLESTTSSERIARTTQP